VFREIFIVPELAAFQTGDADGSERKRNVKGRLEAAFLGKMQI
jgi:hypothetical protein